MDFSKLQSERSEIQGLFVKLDEMKEKIQEQYNLLQKEEQFFGLDSFRFQVKLLENECKHLKDQTIFIENRLYCDYYKLHVCVHEYLSETIHFENPKNPYPLYKDLEPFRVYDVEHTRALYQEIVAVLQRAHETLDLEEKKRAENATLNTRGIHIGNYVHNRIFKDTIIQTNIRLYEQYLNTYFMYHMNFLVHLKERIGLFLNQFQRSEPNQDIVINPVAVEQVDAVDPVVDPVVEQVAVDPVVDPVEQVAVDPVVEQVDPVVEQVDPVVEQVAVDPVDPVVDPVAVDPVVDSVKPVSTVEPLSRHAKKKNKKR